MGKLFVTEFVSIDGVMEAPGGEPGYAHTGWVAPYMADEAAKFKLDETLGSESLLLGRVTYESFRSAWPQREGPFADKMNSMPKRVVTSTLTDDELGWNNAEVVAGDLVEAVTELKTRDEGPMQVAGSKTLVHALLENRLVDELRLMVMPVILGSGFRVFPETRDTAEFKLADTLAFPSGVQVHTYEAV